MSFWQKSMFTICTLKRIEQYFYTTLNKHTHSLVSVFQIYWDWEHDKKNSGDNHIKSITEI